ncbi:MAG: ATP-binding protein [Acidobacteriota bacterium]|nr:ATP-binding protein [Acidobacteriota bacterium]
MQEARLTLAAVGPPSLTGKAKAVAERIGAAFVDPALARSFAEGAADGAAPDVMLVQREAGAPPPADSVRAVARGGGLAIGVVPVSRSAERRALLEAGAVELVAPSVSTEELAQRIGRAVKLAALSERVRQQDRELVLITSLARRLVRSPDTTSLTRDALSGLGRSIGLDSTELRVLSAPWRVDAEASSVVRWDQSEGLTRTSQVPLDPLDLEALRCRMPVPAEGAPGGEVAVPLLAQGQALAVLRATPAVDQALDEDALRTLYVIGSLLAGAMEHAEQVASLQGHSRNLEAQVAERTREAAAQQLLFQAVVDSLPVSLHVIDRTFRVVVWNRGREAGPFGRPRGEVLGHSLFSVIGEDEELRSEYEEVFEDGEPRVTELEGRAGNPPRLFRVEKIPMCLGRGQDVTHVITVSRDMTEQRALERSMARTEKMAAVGRLAAGIAHEINNPLATIAGCAEAMRGRLRGPLEGEDREDVRQDASVIEEEAYRCKDILGSLLDLSRTSPQTKGICDLGDIARRTLKLLRHNPRISGVHLELEVDADTPPTMASADQLVQVLLAILLNAADAAAPNGNVILRTRRGHGGEAVISIEDDGPGISPELQERIFEPFFTTKPPGQGTGLGLSVAYGLVQAHGGRLEMISHPGLGTRFDVIMPAEEKEKVEMPHV